jgi:hypothetical protein
MLLIGSGFALKYDFRESNMHTITDATDLSSQEQELLRAAAANSGMLHVETRCETHGWAVRAGRNKFYDPADLNLAPQYVAKVPRLVELQLVREFGTKNCYELTNFGWQLARKLVQQAKV